MAGRPRVISDERIMTAVASAVGAVGPHRLTLADVARAAGVSTGVLVQRYGSKRGLLLAFVRAGLSGETFPRSIREAFGSVEDPVEGVIRAVLAISWNDISPAEFANHLAFLHLELADDEFRELLGRHGAQVRAEFVALLDAAIAAGTLTGDAERLAAAVDAVRNGTQLTWAMSRTGPLAGALRRDLTTLLQPYVVEER
jgi:AcrR family transcriptional regulator